MTFLFKSEARRGEVWRQRLAEEFPDLDFRVWPDVGDPLQVKYLACWVPPEDLGQNFPNLELVISVGAGVDQIDLASLPAGVQVLRMTEEGLAAGMCEYASMAVLAAHRQLPAYLEQQRQHLWAPLRTVAARNRTVGVMGLGVLGAGLLEKLRPFGFQLKGWSRSAKAVEGVTTYAGPGQFAEFLAGTDILVCLVPLTPDTRGILNKQTFDLLPDGASIVNVGRGGHLVDQDLLDGLASNKLSCAILDVFSSEPLPAEHAFWHHPRILMTPHIASVTDAAGGAEFVVQNLRKKFANLPLTGVVDATRGY